MFKLASGQWVSLRLTEKGNYVLWWFNEYEHYIRTKDFTRIVRTIQELS